MGSSMCSHPRIWLSGVFLIFGLVSSAVVALNGIILNMTMNGPNNPNDRYDVVFSQKDVTNSTREVLVDRIPAIFESRDLVFPIVCGGIGAALSGILILSILFRLCFPRKSTPQIRPHHRWGMYGVFWLLLLGQAILALIVVVRINRDHLQYRNFSIYAGIWPPADSKDEFVSRFYPADLETWFCQFTDFNGTDTEHSRWVKWCPIIESSRLIWIPYSITSTLAFFISYFALRGLGLTRAAGHHGENSDWKDPGAGAEFMPEYRFPLQDAPSHMAPSGEMPILRFTPSQDLDRASEDTRPFMPYDAASVGYHSRGSSVVSMGSFKDLSSDPSPNYLAYDPARSEFEIPTPSAYKPADFDIPTLQHTSRLPQHSLAKNTKLRFTKRMVLWAKRLKPIVTFELRFT